MSKGLNEKEYIILKELIKNHEDFSEDPQRYTRQVDISEKHDIPKSTLYYWFKKLEKKGLIKQHKGKTKDLASITCDNSKIYVLTQEGINHGGLGTEFEKITAGPKNSPLKSSIYIADLHGDLSISFQVNEIPEDDGIVWKENPMNNGVVQKIRTVFKGGDRITIELFEGKENHSIQLKPRIIAGREDTPESLLKAFREAAYAIRTDLELKGYRLGMGQEKGEGKFTIRSKILEDMGYLEGDNTLLDESQGVTEVHPRTGDIDSNKLMAELLTNYRTGPEELEILSDEKVVETLDELGEISKMVTSVKKFSNKLGPVERKQERIERNQQIIAKNVKQLADDFNKLMDMLDQGQKQQKEYSPTKPEPQGGGYL